LINHFYSAFWNNTSFAYLKVYEDMCKEEVKKHVIDIDVDTPAGINAFKPGYISVH